MAGCKGYSQVSKVSGAEKASYDHWHRQQQQQRKPAKGFAAVLKRAMARIY